MTVQSLPVPHRAAAARSDVVGILADMLKRAEAGEFDTVMVIAGCAASDETVFSASGTGISEQLGELERAKFMLLTER